MTGGSTKPVWITGAGGLIGNQLVTLAPQYVPVEWEGRGLSHAELDLTDATAVRAQFRREQPAAVIHCAAVSRSPVCEGEPQLARRINVDATRALAELASAIPFFFFSSDLVFDGAKGNYTEDDAPNPLSVYGETKVLAEQIVRANSGYTIIRISLTGGKSPKGDRGFNEEMKNAWRAGKSLNLFLDEYRCPAPAEAIARAVWELFLKQVTGTFHVCGAERLSRYDMGMLIAARHPELNPKIIPGSRKDYKGPPRPADTSLDCTKAQRLLSFPLPRFSEWIKTTDSDF